MTKNDNKPLKRVNLSDQIFQILKEKISSGEWKPGDRIPPETELAATFGVSRMTARSAIQKLATIGLTESRTGDGSFVKDFHFNDLFNDLSVFLCSKQNMEDLCVFRSFFERDCMTLACRERTEKDIEKLKSIHKEMLDSAQRYDINAFNEADGRFHEQIIEMTGNAIFKLVGSMVQGLLKAHYVEATGLYKKMHQDDTPDSADDQNILQDLCREHAVYIESLEKRDPSLTMNRLDAHLQLYNTMR